MDHQCHDNHFKSSLTYTLNANYIRELPSIICFVHKLAMFVSIRYDVHYACLRSRQQHQWMSLGTKQLNIRFIKFIKPRAFKEQLFYRLIFKFWMQNFNYKLEFFLFVFFYYLLKISVSFYVSNEIILMHKVFWSG